MTPKDCDPVITVKGLKNAFGDQVIHDGLDPECPAALEVGLHPGVPEVGIEGYLVATAQ